MNAGRGIKVRALCFVCIAQLGSRYNERKSDSEDQRVTIISNGRKGMNGQQIDGG